VTADPSTTPEQRLRLERLMLAVSATAVTIVIAFGVVYAGYLPLRAAVIYTAVVAVLGVGFHRAIQGRLARKVSDPSLTVPQLVAAGLAVSYLAYEGFEARPVFMAMYLIAHMFGVFRLGPAGLVGIAGFYVACYVAVAGLSLLTRPTLTDPHRELFRIVALALLLGWSAALASYISDLRRKLRRAVTHAEALATHDSLTGCYNRRRMMELLAVEAKRAARGSAFSVCLIDADNFKTINDSYGHLSGDEVLKQLAATVQPMLRATDFLARYGGEEFLVGLSQTALAGAALVGERVRRAVAERTFPSVPPAQHVTVSIGVAEHHPPDPMDSTLRRADAALYEAKRQGRNQVVIAG
jgi:diguanylate cyclase (GGDEF)-like protein